MTEKPWGHHNWTKFHKWLKDDGLGIIKQWAIDFAAEDVANVVYPGEQAPMTRRKKSVCETMLSDAERLVLDRMAAIKDKMVDKNGDGIPFYVVISDLRTLVKNEIYPGKNDYTGVESAYRLKKLLRSNGFHTSPSRVRCPGGHMSDIIGNYKKALEGSFEEVNSAAQRIPIYADDPRILSLQNCM